MNHLNLPGEKFDRGFDPGEIRWVIHAPDMQDSLMLATDEQAAQWFTGVSLEEIKAAKPGDWMRYKEGIGIRLGSYIADADGY